MRCSVGTLLHTPHSCMHTPPQEDKCRLLPQPKPVPTEGGEGEGEGEELTLGSVCHVRLVPASMSCTVSVQKVTAGNQT